MKDRILIKIKNKKDRTSIKIKNKTLIILLGIAILFLAGCAKMGNVGSAHEHANFKVYINGEALDFSQSIYMVKSGYVHIEGMNGNLIHKHATGVTLGYFFTTLGIKFNNECFVFNKKKYCNKDDKTLKFYVNGKRNFEFGDYEIKDLDKYLISYGNDSEEEIQKQLASVTSKTIERKIRN